MRLLDQRLVGVVILFVLGMLVVVKRRATGSMIDLPGGDFLLKSVNIFNLLFLLAVSPVAAVLLITGTVSSIDPHARLRSRSRSNECHSVSRSADVRRRLLAHGLGLDRARAPAAGAVPHQGAGDLTNADGQLLRKQVARFGGAK